jgi:Contractile injection system tape measure protein
MQFLEFHSNTVRHLDRQAWLLFLSEISPQQPLERTFPTATWSRNWLAQLLQTSRLDTITQQQLRSSIETLPISERFLWLTALEQALNLTPYNFNLSSVQDAEDQTGDRPSGDWEVLLYFLSFGHLPLEHSSTDLLTLLPRWEAIMQTATFWQMPLRELLTTNPAAQQRLVAQLPAGFRHQLILHLQPAWTVWHALLAQARGLMQSLSLSDDTCQQLERQAWLLLLAEIELDNTSGRPLPAATWSRNWLAQLIQTCPELREIPIQIASQYLRDIIGELPITEKSLWQTALNQVLTSTSVDTNTRSLNLREAQTSSTNAISPQEETAGLFVNQAGLVLLHPFLRNYFDAVGLLNGDSFQDESAQQTAIYLLHYLATRQTDAPEYELVLPKLLCGWLLNEPVNREIELPTAALMEGEHLLQTAINYWQALKSTSPDGLRQGFLQREGKLTRSSDGNWKLQVEQKSIDILLSRLPWGLSMVKLPWMDELLIVEWN